MKVCQRCGRFIVRKSKMIFELDSKKQKTGFVRCENEGRCEKRQKKTEKISGHSASKPLTRTKFHAKMETLK